MLNVMLVPVLGDMVGDRRPLSFRNDGPPGHSCPGEMSIVLSNIPQDLDERRSLVLLVDRDDSGGATACNVQHHNSCHYV